MRIDTVENEVFKFDELSEEGKQKAIESQYDINLHDEWHECTYDDAKAIAELMGIEISNIWFSGFSCQGDGACFEGSYSYEKGGVKAVKDYASVDKELHRIAAALQETQRKCFYGLGASIKHDGHYYHESCTEINVYNGRDEYDSASISTEVEITETLRDFMKWIYKQLEAQHDYLTSEEAIIETIKANDYEFTADGKIY